MSTFVLYVIMVLSSVSFFNPFGLINAQLMKLITYSTFIISLAIAEICPRKRNLSKDFPKKTYVFLVLGIMFSMVMVMLFQEQSFSDTVVATIYYILPYSTLYILIKYNISSYKIIRFIKCLCIISMIVYVVNYIMLPYIVFGSIENELDNSRGFFRLSIPFIEFFVFYLLYSVNQWVEYKKKKDIIFAAILYLFIIFSLTRQIILLSTVLSLILILKRMSVVKKIMLTIAVILLFHFVLPQIPVYQSLMETSKEQIERNEDHEDVRLNAYEFYIYKNQTNALTPFFGNGVPSFISPWGKRFETEIIHEHAFAVDVGWAGFYWYFGFFTTLALFLLLCRAIRKRKSKDNKYLSYWLTFIIFTSLASGPILYHYQIVSILTVVYLVYHKEYDSDTNS